jgi:uncharacterized protein YkwD
MMTPAGCAPRSAKWSWVGQPICTAPEKDDNEDMYRVAAGAALASAFTLAACGGGGKHAAPVHSAKPGAGVVSAQATKGLLGTATLIGPAGTTVIGPAGPINPNASRPTQAQQNGVGGVGVCASASANPVAANIARVSAAILCLLNSERAVHGLPPLHSNGKLSKAAKRWAARMVQRRFFSHEAGSSSPLTRVQKTGYVHGNWSVGENIAWGNGPLATPRSIMNGWMHSPGHRANILRGQFRDIGIGIRIGAPGQGLSGGATYVTDFGKHS